MDYYLQGFFAFKGRLTRLPYFLFSFAIFITILVLSYLWTLYEVAGVLLTMETIAVGVICILAGWSNLAVTVKRLHDMGLSGWHMAWMSIPVIAQVFPISANAILICWTVGFVISLWLIFTPSSKSERYST